MLRLEVALYALEMLEGMPRTLLCMLEAVEGELCLLEVLVVLVVMRCLLLCIWRLWTAGSLLEVMEMNAMCADLYAGGREG